MWQAGPVPQRHCPLTQPLASVASHVPHTPPWVPQAEMEGGWHTPDLQQLVAHEAAPQPQEPPTQVCPPEQGEPPGPQEQPVARQRSEVCGSQTWQGEEL